MFILKHYIDLKAMIYVRAPI